MSEGLLSGVLPAVYSRADAFKRKLVDALRNPGDTLRNVRDNVVDDIKRADQMVGDASAETMAALRSGGKPFSGPANERMAQALADAYNPAGITVYHSSPFKFPKFDSSKIGTGEGSQVYGHGLYLAESPAVSGKGGQYFEQFKKHPAVKETGGPYAYKVDLPDEQVAKMLDWDKPIYRQAPNVREAVRQIVDEKTAPGTYAQWIRAARPDIKTLQNDMLESMDNAQIAEALKQKGIPGIRYLDQQSRARNTVSDDRLFGLYEKHGGNAEAAVDEFMRSIYNTPKKKEAMRAQFLKELEVPRTRNFVVFPGNEDLLTIQEINGQPVQSVIEALRRR